MKPALTAAARSRSPLTRHLLLGAALVGALIVGMPPGLAPARAQPAPAAAPPPADSAREAAGFKARITIDADAKPAAPDADAPARPGIVVEKDGKKVHVPGLHGDAEYDSFNDLVTQEPWLGALIFFSVAMVFLVPLLLVLALIWYKMRKNRMLNETMLKLAEKGVVPATEAVDALAGNTARTTASPAADALYARAIALRKRTSWSDLRKGIVMGGIGAAVTLAVMINDGEASGVGLVLLFVGIGYGVLWWFEERQIAAARVRSGDAPTETP